MSVNIILKKGYILIELEEGPDFSEIRRGIARLYYVPELIHKNVIWVFHKGAGNLSHDDLNKLKDIIRENRPKGTKAKKTALVAETEEQLRTAEAFAKITNDLPYEFKVFTSQQDAEAWITA